MIQYGYDFNENSIYFIIDFNLGGLLYCHQAFRTKETRI